MPISDPPNDLCNIRLWLVGLKDVVNSNSFDFTSQDAYKVFGVGSSPGIPSYILLDAAHVQTGVLDNARVNWASPAVIGSVTPNNAFFNNSVINSLPSTTAGNAPTFSLRKFNGANYTTFNAVTSGHALGNITFLGTTSNAAIASGGVIQGIAAENWSPSATGTNVKFILTVPGGTSTTDALTVYGARGINMAPKTADYFNSANTNDIWYFNNSLWSNNNVTRLRLHGLMYNALNDVTVTNTVTETSLVDTAGRGYANLTFLANYLNTNQVLRIRASGTFAATHTDRILTIRIKYGITILSTASVTLTNQAADATNGWHLDAYMILRGTGATSAIRGGGTLIYTAAGSTAQTRSFQINTNIDTTVSRTMDVTAIWNAASTNNSITCHSMVWDWE